MNRIGIKLAIMTLGLLLATLPSAAFAAQATPKNEEHGTRSGAIIFGVQEGGNLFLGSQRFSGSLLEDHATHGLRLGYSLLDFLDFETAFTYVRTEAGPNNIDVFTYHGGLVAHLFPLHVWTPYISGGIGGYTIDADITNTSDTDLSIAYGAGLKWFFLPSIALRAEARAITLITEKATNLEITGGLIVYANLFEKNKDSDGDGILDKHDQCPKEAEDADGFQDDDGCPELDNDGDGILDSEDRCPDEPEDKDGNLDEDGCPDLDDDQDGVDNNNDQCPNEKEDLDGFKDEDGCPDIDNDNDTILDADDQCPNEPETMNGFLDGDGCPDKQLEEFSGVISGIKFALDSTQIDVISYPVLDRAAAVFSDFDNLIVTIEGHTDSTGSQQYNLDLSENRAEAVRQFLIAKGLDPTRIEVEAFGEDRPIADNKTEEGRAKNRRIELKLKENPGS